MPTFSVQNSATPIETALPVASLPTDSDEDGTTDDKDECPSDPAKTAPGVCGCSIADLDYDGDGVLYCIQDCGNGSCDWSGAVFGGDPNGLRETPWNCNLDCGCGNGVCDTQYEDSLACPQDCFCGDGLCYNQHEDSGSCPQDCGWCGDNECRQVTEFSEEGETNDNCPNDCFCGDLYCADEESPDSCNADCGYCGDGVCGIATVGIPAARIKEDMKWCPQDCERIA